jgi:hypothetical protein
MKALVIAFGIASLLFCACKKNDQQKAAAGQNYWEIGRDSYGVQRNMYDSMPGFYLTFLSDSAQEDAMVFQFRSRPVASGVYLITDSPRTTNEVSVWLRHSMHRGVSFKSLSTGATMNLTMQNGKINIHTSNVYVAESYSPSAFDTVLINTVSVAEL